MSFHMKSILLGLYAGVHKNPPTNIRAVTTNENHVTP